MERALSPPGVGSPPKPREWRARLRRARRQHHERSLGKLLSDLYTLLFLILVYGAPLASSVRRHLGLAPSGARAEAVWLTVAVLLTGVGILWRGFTAVGPLIATPPEQTWVVSTPLDRRGWLLPRLVLLLMASGSAVAAVVGATGMVLHGGGLGWAALAGGLFGIALAGASVTAQGGVRDARWSRRGSAGLIVSGVLTAVVVVISNQAGHSLSARALPSPFALAMVAAPLSFLGIVGAVRALARMDLVSLSAGAQLAEATITATLAVDLSILSGILEVRHWRQVGRVSSRRFLYGRLGRGWVLLQAELRRQWRRPNALGAWVALAVAQYAVALLAPSLASVAHVILAYVAANRLAAGLRVLSRSPGLRRALGGEELRVRLIHLVIPTVGAGLWWLATWPAGGIVHTSLDLILLAGISGATYRAATRGPLSYGGVVMETPFGLFPLELVLQMARGPDLLGAVLLLQWIAIR